MLKTNAARRIAITVKMRKITPRIMRIVAATDRFFTGGCEGATPGGDGGLYTGAGKRDDPQCSQNFPSGVFIPQVGHRMSGIYRHIYDLI